MSTNEESDDLMDEELADMEEEDNWPESLRKPRRDSLSGKLELDGRRQLEIWLRDENRTYAEVRELLKQEFGVETSEAALCRYYERWITPSLVARKVGCVSRTWERFPSASLESAVMARARQMSYDEMMKREPDLRAVKRLMAMVDGMERRQLARERVALEQRRVKLKEEAARPKAMRDLAWQRTMYGDLGRRTEVDDPMDEGAAEVRKKETPNTKIPFGDAQGLRQASGKIQTGGNEETGKTSLGVAGPEAEDPNAGIQAPGKQQENGNEGKGGVEMGRSQGATKAVPPTEKVPRKTGMPGEADLPAGAE